MDGDSSGGGYSDLFYFMLVVGIIGVVGFAVVCGSIQ
jgi:hypothetical protein